MMHTSRLAQAPSVGLLLPRRQIVRFIPSALGLGVMPLAWAQAAAGKAIEQPLRQQINYTTRLSIVSDRLVRNHVQKHLHIEVPRPEKGVADCYAEIKKALGELKAVKTSKALSAQLPIVSKAYSDFVRTSEQLPVTDRPGLIKLTEQADTVGEAVDKLVEALVKESGFSSAEALSLTADLQRLTQHLAVHYLMAKAGVDAAEQMKEVVKGRADFKAKLGKLKQSSFKPEQAEEMLQLIDNQWLLMDKALQETTATTKTLENICTTSERSLDTLAALYHKYETAL